MIECCLDTVCFCLLHDTNLGPTLPAGCEPATFDAALLPGEQPGAEAGITSALLFLEFVVGDPKSPQKFDKSH